MPKDSVPSGNIISIIDVTSLKKIKLSDGLASVGWVLMEREGDMADGVLNSMALSVVVDIGVGPISSG